MISPPAAMRFVIFLLCVISIVGRATSQKEFESCGNNGTCRGYSHCRDQLQNRRPKICGYNSKEAIVCCPPANTSAETKNERKAVLKCNEYRKLSFKRIAMSSFSMNPSVRNFVVPKCQNVVKFIVGGTVTKPGEFPHMAAIGWRRMDRDTFDCGGSLISDRFVLTAAHCYVELEDVLPSFVRLGDQHLFRDDDRANPKDYDIEDFITHPQFIRKHGMYNDIALIKLDQSVRFTNFIRPACLHDKPQLAARHAIATGFGLTSESGDKSNELLKVSLKIFNNTECNESFSHDRKVRKGIKDSQICAGSYGGPEDTCQGDSGGPLQGTKPEHQCVFYIFGITSFGKACGSAEPAVYTRVGSYLDWIESIVWE